MGKIRILSRPEPNTLPDFPLPFHVRSVGSNDSDFGWKETVPGEKKQFVQLFWTVAGSGRIVLPDREFVTCEGEVFHHLPGEDHNHFTNWNCFCRNARPTPFVTRSRWRRKFSRLLAGGCTSAAVVTSFGDSSRLRRSPRWIPG